MKRPAPLLAVALGLALVVSAAPAVKRAALEAIEKNLNRRVEGFSIHDPIFLLSSAQGVYLAGYGAVFTAEVNLAPVAITPFRPALSGEEKAKLRDKKVERLGAIRRIMRETLVDAGASLDTVPAEERIALAVGLFHFSWEDTTGLPDQLLMHAVRRDLVDFKAGRLNETELAQKISVEPF